MAPSTVGTSTVNGAVSDAGHFKVFYAQGLFWVFYSDGTNMGYKTSADGVTWSAWTIVRVAAQGYRFSVAFDGTNFHYVVFVNTGLPNYYRMGTANPDGTITWLAAEQDCGNAVAGWNLAAPRIRVDSDGYPWIAWRQQLPAPATRYAYVSKSSTKNGIWTNAAGFPFQLSPTNFAGLLTDTIPLTGAKVLAIYTCIGLPVMSRQWDGASWGLEKTTTSIIQHELEFCAVNQGDDVHLVFTKSATFDILYARYSYSSGSWGPETTIQAATTSNTCPILAIHSKTSVLYCFWIGTPTVDHIFSKRNVYGAWDTLPTDLITDVNIIINGIDKHPFCCFYTDYGDYLGLVYMTGLASPFNVRFAFLPVPYVPTLRMTQVGNNLCSIFS